MEKKLLCFYRNKIPVPPAIFFKFFSCLELLNPIINRVIFYKRKADRGKTITQTGQSLLELLISLMLSLSLLGFLVQWYVTYSKQYQAGKKELEKILNRQLFDDMLRESIQHAGFAPCLNLNDLISFDYAKGQPLQAFSISENKSKLTFSRMHHEQFELIQRFSGLNQVTIQGKSPVEKKQWAVIADCYHAEVLQIEDIITNQTGMTRLTFKHPLRYSYQLNEAYIGKWVKESFDIRPIGHTKPTLSALYYEHERHSEVLWPGVEAMTVQLQQLKGKSFLMVLLKEKTGMHEVGGLVRGG